MRRLSPFVLLLLSSLLAAGAPTDSRQKTVSSSRQFAVYCTDAALRSRIASFADDVRSDVLHLLGSDDFYGNGNIVLTIDKAEGAGQPPPHSLFLK